MLCSFCYISLPAMEMETDIIAATDNQTIKNLEQKLDRLDLNNQNEANKNISLPDMGIDADDILADNNAIASLKERLDGLDLSYQDAFEKKAVLNLLNDMVRVRRKELIKIFPLLRKERRLEKINKKLRKQLISWQSATEHKGH